MIVTLRVPFRDSSGALGDSNLTSQRIEYLSVIGGPDGLRITFRGGSNCVIGACGTGKTTAVEFVGYAIDALQHREHAADERKRI